MPFDAASQSEPAWFCLAVESNQEWTVRKRLRRACIDHYLPVEEVRGRGKDKAHRNRKAMPREVPFIRGYVFVRGPRDFLVDAFDARRDDRRAEQMPGVLCMVRGASEHPTPIPEAALAVLKRLEDPDGVIRVRQSPKSRFKAGQRLRINGGPTEGYLGQFLEAKGEDKIKMLLAWGPTTIEAELVSAA